MNLDAEKQLQKHAPKYKNDAWKQYDLYELGMWVHLLVKRSGHRLDQAKRQKDLDDAQNYLAMMQSYIDDARREPE